MVKIIVVLATLVPFFLCSTVKASLNATNFENLRHQKQIYSPLPHQEDKRIEVNYPTNSQIESSQFLQNDENFATYKFWESIQGNQAQEMLLKMQRELDAFELEAQNHAAQAQLHVKRVQTQQKQLSQVLSMIPPIYVHQNESDSNFTEQYVSETKDIVIKPMVTNNTEKNLTYLKQDFQEIESLNSSKNQIASSNDDKVLKAGDSTSFTVRMNSTDNFFSVYGFLYIGFNISNNNWTDYPIAFDTTASTTVVQSTYYEVYEYYGYYGYAQCWNCEPLGIFDCANSNMAPYGCISSSTYWSSYEYDWYFYFNDNSMMYFQDTELCLSADTIMGCVVQDETDYFRLDQVYEQGENSNLTMPGTNFTGNSTYYYGRFGLGKTSLVLEHFSYSYVWAQQKGGSNQLTFKYSLKEGNSTLSFGDLTGTQQELQSRKFIGTMTNQQIESWGFYLKDFKLKQIIGKNYELPNAAQGYVASSFPYIGLPKVYFDHFIDQEPIAKAFKDPPTEDGLYISPHSCDYLSATYCITQDYSLSFHAYAQADGEEFWFNISPETYLRPLSNTSCALMVVNQNVTATFADPMYFDPDTDFMMGLPFFFSFDIELNVPRNQISLYVKDSQSSVTLTICKESEYGVFMAACLSTIMFL